MFGKIFALFALFAVAFAAPKAEPAPQYLAAGVGYVSPYSAVPVPSYVSPYAAAPLAYSGYPAAATYEYFVR